MSYILHMSDFHFGKNYTLEKNRLFDLAAFIGRKKIKIHSVVFTGDMIDAQSTTKKCIESLKNVCPQLFKDIDTKAKIDIDYIAAIIASRGEDAVQKYNSEIKKYMDEAMECAADIFREFLAKINVNSDNVILCCGNHDRIRLVDEPKQNCGYEHRLDENSITEPFEVYNCLCKKINNKLSFKTSVYKANEINYVILNTNWMVPDAKNKNNVCINCGSVSDVIKKLENSAEVNRNNTILISHKPWDEFCETVKYPYSGEQLSLSDVIANTVSLALYGDKHSYAIRKYNRHDELLCGSPLSDGTIRYNLIDFDSAREESRCNYIFFDGKQWIQIPISECQCEVFEESKPYLKHYSFDIIEENRSTKRTWDKTIDLVETAINAGHMKTISEFFSAICDLKQGPTGVEINSSDFIFQLISVINTSAFQAVGVKGKPGVGKSTFLTLVYMCWYYLFCTGQNKFMPFYFNVESILNKVLNKEKAKYDADEYINVIYRGFSRFLTSCIKLKSKYNIPVCLIIDGLEKSKILKAGKDTLENKMYQLVECKLNNTCDRYVMCFNTHDSYHFEDSFDSINKFDYVLYINDIRTLPYKNKDVKLDSYLKSYLLLNKQEFDDQSITQLKETLVKFRMATCDLFLLHHADHYINGIKSDEEIWSVLKGYVSLLEKISNSMFHQRIEQIQYAAGILFSQRICFDEIAKMGEFSSTLSIIDFLKCVNAPIVKDYLIASYYISQLSYYCNVTSEIPSDSILFSFIPHNLALLMRVILDSKSSCVSILAQFLHRHEQECTGFLYSTFVYLCGHLRSSSSEDLIKKLPKPDACSYDFFQLCHRRSYDLACAVHSYDKFPLENIILEFINNESYRRFNRAYQLYYYRDYTNNKICNRNTWNVKSASIPGNGFDFRCTFLMLLSKLEDALCKRKQTLYPLLQLDLFTLCDLIYSHLQYITPKGFFYSKKYNEDGDSECEAVLSRAIKLLESYNKAYGGKKSRNERIGAYFNLMYDRFTRVIGLVRNNYDKDVCVPYVSPAADYANILRLSNYPTVGWNINKPDLVEMNDLPSYERDKITGCVQPRVYEVLMQHVIESVYIAQLFLPDQLEGDGYCKDSVISLLLFSELGKIEIGDYSPFYYNAHHLDEKNNNCLSQISVLGALDGYARQPAFARPVSQNTPTDINMQICWEIKMIQREYKYYTLYDKIGFDKDRREQFEKDFEEPSTPVCRYIREQLIINNPVFKKYF